MFLIYLYYFQMFRNMKKYFSCLKATLIVLLGSAVILASCKKDEDPKSSACEIVSFKVGDEAWTIAGTDITHNFPSETVEGTLVPTIEVSKGATVSPASGAAQNFFTADGVTYTVTAEDGTTKKAYTVKATVAQSSACDILSFTVDGEAWTITGQNITKVYPAETVEGDLTPVITLSAGATVDPASGVAKNLFVEGGVAYTVTAEDGTTKVYTVSATKTPSTEAKIISFTVDDVEWKFFADEFFYTYPPETETGLLTPTIEVSPGATVTPASGEAQNFFEGEAVQYTVTAQDGTTKKTYLAHARRELYTGNDVLSFVLGDVEWEINGTDITYTYPAGATIPQEMPIITVSPGATVDIPADVTLEGLFSEEGIEFTVTSEGNHQQRYVARGTFESTPERYKYDKHDWVVLPKSLWHIWGGDGEGALVNNPDNLVWGGGHPMLILDDDPGSGWHCTVGYPLPHVLVIDMKDSYQVSEVVATALYAHTVELYVTDNLGFGYDSHNVTWDDWRTNREPDYHNWANSWESDVPLDVLGEWGEVTYADVTPLDANGVLNFETDHYSQISFSLRVPKDGRYLIIRFTDSTSPESYAGMFSLDVYE
jgi:hypothetical protein